MSSRLISNCPELWAQVLEKDGHIIKGRWKKKVPISSLTVSANVSIKWKCHDGEWPNGDYADDHVWEQEIYARWDRKKQKPRKCPFCPGEGRISVCRSNSLGATDSNLISEWHPDNEITPFEVLPYSHTEVKWKCHDGKWPDGTPAEDHVWNAKVSDRSRGRGCPFCHGDAVCESNSLPTTHPDLVKEWHPDNLHPASEFKAGTSKRFIPIWKCYKGKWPDGTPADDHVWTATIAARTGKKTGCPFCPNASKSRARACPSNSLAANFPELAKQWSQKNRLEPNQVLPGSNDKFLWNCEKDESHEYPQSPKSKTTQNAGCTRCKKKNETKLYEYCKQLFPKFEIERNKKGLFQKNKRMELDIWIPELNLGFEYQGEQHYIVRRDWPNGEELLLQTKKRDQLKKEYCAELGITMIEIKYDWGMDRSVVIEELENYGFSVIM